MQPSNPPRHLPGQSGLRRNVRLRSGRSWLFVCLCVAAAHSSPAERTHPERAYVHAETDAVESPVASLLAKMTLEEKLGQLNQPSGPDYDTGPAGQVAALDAIRRGEVGSILGMQGVTRACALQKIAVEESRLGIPMLFAYDVIHGFRTIFPVPLGEAASFDPIVAERSARIAAIEAAAHGVHWTYAPMVDIARDARWGRIVEGAGEDPYLGAAFAAARVRGFQGDDLAADDTVLATAKHFVAYGAAEAGRDYNTVDISERTLREVYLPPFRAALDAGAGSVMASFNEIAGVPMHAHRGLIDGVLRREWGFEGLVVSDYTGVMELMRHGIAGDRANAGRQALDAGVDVDMVSDIYRKDLPAEVRAGRVPVAAVDAAVRRVLRAKYRLGLFDDPYRYCNESRERERTLTAEHRRVAREVARKTLVLLKNENALLPLSKDIRTLAVIGPLADNARDMLGNWAAEGRAEDAVTPLAGIRAAVSPQTRVLYARGADIRSNDTSGFAEAVRIAAQADAVLLFLGESEDMSAEANSRTSLDLPGVQMQLASAVRNAGKPTIAVLFNGRPLSIEPLQQEVPAIVEAWFPGVEAGNAIADVLFGDHNPAGRLPVTFPRNVGQAPIHYAHKNTGRPPSDTDRYTSKYIDAPWTPLYPFGYGLSYTTFRYSDLNIAKPAIRADETQRIEVTVENTGHRAGDEVVQLYLRDDVASITRPVRELRGFRRIHLRPGERRMLRFDLKPDDLALYDAKMRRVVEPGTFTVFIGGDSTAAMEARFKVVSP
ncbi:MAG: glycosyl hydrolase [Lysobacteraceae bacterium]|nr:MAG: glycosyl hydrolase [Xanthomonadaceae bacterium]